MTAKPMPRLFTVDEYCRMGEAGILTEDDRVELIEGKIIQMPPIGSRHASCVGKLTRLLIQGLGARAIVWPQNPLRLSDRSEPVPDLAVHKPRDDEYSIHPPTATDALLVIEIADTTLTFDHRVKLPLYAREGVPEAWIVELTRSRISVHREPTPDGYKISQIFVSGERITPLAFPDLALAVSDILV